MISPNFFRNPSEFKQKKKSGLNLIYTKKSAAPRQQPSQLEFIKQLSQNVQPTPIIRYRANNLSMMQQKRLKLLHFNDMMPDNPVPKSPQIELKLADLLKDILSKQQMEK
jgi:hypothetical protein